MDGTLAAIFFIASLTDMGLNHCGNDGCWAEKSTDSRFSVSAGDVVFQRKSVDSEVFLRYDFGKTYGPFQPTAGVSLTGSGDAWVGVGAVFTKQVDRFYVQLSAMPGLYARGSGPDLGHSIEFRSGAEVGYEARNGWRVGLSYDHRSNAELSSLNPGLETLQLRVSVPLK